MQPFIPTGSLATFFGSDNAGPVERWPPDRLLAYQRDAIAEQLRHVEANNPLYRDKLSAAGLTAADFGELADLARFPFTNKRELLRKPWALLSLPREQVCLTHTSTGTTGGDWSYILYSWDDMHGHDVLPAPRLLMPVQAGDVVINALPYEMSSSGQSFQRSLQAGAGALVVPVGKGGFYSDPAKTIDIMADLAANVLITTPPYAMLLSEIAARRGLKAGHYLRPRFMWITGEGCSPAYRRRLQEIWNCPALVFYGSMECGSIAIEGPAQDGSYVSGGQVYVEIIDPQSGQPLPPGQVGEVVCTVLQRKASPLIRYRTADLGLLDVSPGKDGFTLPRLFIRGRMADQIAQPAGEAAAPLISPYMVEDVLYAQPEMGGNYQLYTVGPRLLIDAEPRGSAGELTAAADRIVAALAQRGVTAELRWTPHIPRAGGKTRRLRPFDTRDWLMSQPCLLQGE
ncbi:MAG: phenylacetate--CoA ligase family protein [Pirellulales bacterium]